MKVPDINQVVHGINRSQSVSTPPLPKEAVICGRPYEKNW